MPYPVPNQHGVYAEDPALELAIRDKKFSARVNWLKIADDTWVSSTHYDIPTSGGGGPLTASWKTFPTAREAIHDGLTYLASRASRNVEEVNSCTGTSGRKMAAKIRDWALAQAKRHAPSRSIHDILRQQRLEKPTPAPRKLPIAKPAVSK